MASLWVDKSGGRTARLLRADGRGAGGGGISVKGGVTALSGGGIATRVGRVGTDTEDVDAESVDGGGLVGACRCAGALGLDGPATAEAAAETPKYRRIVGVRGAENLYHQL